MTPTLAGRIQTRLALAAVPGLPAAALAATALDTLPLGDALAGLGIITLLGVGWDAAYQTLQGRRWDRDWPRVFTLASWAPEAFGSWLVLDLLGFAAPLGTHLAFFTLLWGAALVFRVAVLPVVLPHWRHEGQRVLGDLRTARTSAAEAVAAEPTAVATERTWLGALGLQPSTARLAAVALLLGTVGALVLLAPMLDDKDDKTVTAEARLTTSDPGAGGGAERGGRDEKDWDTSKRVVPAYLEFEAADLATPLKMTLMKPDGVLVTPSPETAAWYGQGAAPGQRGPAVVIGSTDAIFDGIDKARRGQELRVTRADRSEVTFVVDRVTTVDARDFPTQKVYGANPEPLLRLVGFDETSGRNTIVFAHAVAMTGPAEG